MGFLALGFLRRCGAKIRTKTLEAHAALFLDADIFLFFISLTKEINFSAPQQLLSTFGNLRPFSQNEGRNQKLVTTCDAD
jgi:hypothetical protein